MTISFADDDTDPEIQVKQVNFEKTVLSNDSAGGLTGGLVIWLGSLVHWYLQ